MSDYHFSPDQEQWKEIPGTIGYEISDHGRVRSYWKYSGKKTKYGFWEVANVPQRILNPFTQAGYPCINMKINYKRSPRMVHRLVLLTFVGPCPTGMQACHGDGIRSNISYSNLRWDTVLNNKADSRRHGTIHGPKGSNHAKAKLIESQVLEIRHLYSQGITRRELSRIFPVSYSTINRILRHAIWSHI